MNDKTQAIIELLKEGRSYQYIQTALGVSPTKISNAKKKMQEYLSSNDFVNSTTGSDSESTTEKEANDNYPSIEQYVDTPTKNSSSGSTTSSSDSETALRMREMDLKHQLILKKMEYEDKEKERKFHQNQKEAELKEARLKNEMLYENKLLKKQMVEAKSKLENMDDDTYEDIDSDSEFDAFTEEFESKFAGFTDYLFEHDNTEFDLKMIDELLERISNLIKDSENYYLVCAIECEEHQDYKFLKKVKKSFENLRSKFENKEDKKFKVTYAGELKDQLSKYDPTGRT